MKKILSILIFILLVLSVSLERRAAFCGTSFIQAGQPADFAFDWFNGSFRVNDSEGWGLVYPGGRIELDDSPDVEVVRIKKYSSNEEELILLVEDANLKDYYFSLKAAEGGRGIKFKKLKKKDAEGMAVNWKKVDPSACMWGKGNVFQILFFILILVLSWKLFFKSK
ncbi:hypothetical protein HCU74_11180 [Spongiibacter sp. KMU-166]|uniref:Uncharacterized protein n=1 Tax=Spongiibacter thalassae TaxID=2721624 RepID=A0ABX1GFI4_9GAMM|nr:hypothetical protein [Spongiibacter thalassae]NKI17969.1 hypothetical protein [Spongiibacter thalassae]